MKARMMAVELSQAELARRVGVAQPTIYGLIHSNKIGSKHIHRIARELSTTPAYLTGETDDPDQDAPEEPELTIEQRDLLGLFAALGPKERQAVMTIMAAMVGTHQGATLHAPKLEFHAQGAQD